MDKIVVIFESKYGYTKKYAEWIASELGCPALERKKCSAETIDNFETVIYGGGLYAGGVNGIKLLTQNRQLLADKHVILFTCGLADPDDPENVKRIRAALSKTIPQELLVKMQVFHFRGGIDYSRLSLTHRAMMSMLRKMLLKKDEGKLSDEDRTLLDTYGESLDFTDHDSIFPLIRCVLKITA